MIVQNVSTERHRAAPTSRSRCRKTDGPTAMAALSQVQDEVGFRDLLYDDHIGKVSLIGAGMRSHPGVAAEVLRRARPRPASTSR